MNFVDSFFFLFFLTVMTKISCGDKIYAGLSKTLSEIHGELSDMSMNTESTQQSVLSFTSTTFSNITKI